MSSDADDDNGDPRDARDLFKWLSREVRDLSCARAVPRVDGSGGVDALAFLRDHVARNSPCVISNAIDHWPALTRWKDPSYLADVMGDAVVSVNVTPNGRGDALLDTDGWRVVARDGGGGDDRINAAADDDDDAVVDVHPKPREVFVAPEERRETFRDFLRELNDDSRRRGDDSHPPVVRYISKQCGSLLDEFPALTRDCERELEWATAAFGAPPDAVNLWCGDDRAVTTFHKDHYENVYCVVTGTKTFALLPPCDGARLKPREAPAATFVAEDRTRARPLHTGPRTTAFARWTPILKDFWRRISPPREDAPRNRFALRLERPARSVAWSSVDVDDLARDGYPPPLLVDVHAGEILYLPALWHHRVSQRRGKDGEPCAAVNFWHDMAFDDRHACARFLDEARARFEVATDPTETSSD